jgi:hypothetical protein
MYRPPVVSYVPTSRRIHVPTFRRIVPTFRRILCTDLRPYMLASP